MEQVNLDEAKKRLSELVNAALNGERVFIARDDNELVQLVPTKSRKVHRQFGSAKGLITIAPDFDAPLDDFAEYMP